MIDFINHLARMLTESKQRTLQPNQTAGTTKHSIYSPGEMAKASVGDTSVDNKSSGPGLFNTIDLMKGQDLGTSKKAFWESVGGFFKSMVGGG